MAPDAPVRVGRDHEKRYPGARKLATEVVINLMRTEGLVGTELNRIFRRHKLSAATFNLLMILEGAGGPLCPWEIGERLLVTRGTVTGLLDSLEKQGLIVRSVHPEDRRMLQIEHTERARALLKKVWSELFPIEVELVEVLSAREQEQLVRLLGKLQTHVRGRTAPDRASL